MKILKGINIKSKDSEFDWFKTSGKVEVKNGKINVEGNVQIIKPMKKFPMKKNVYQKYPNADLNPLKYKYMTMGSREIFFFNSARAWQ